jgi:hypothetical protein
MSDKRTSAKYDYLIKLLLIGDSREQPFATRTHSLIALLSTEADFS